MFLTILLVSFAVLTVTAVMVAGLAPHDDKGPALQPDRALAAPPPQFFASDARPAATRHPIPIELLLSQVERHIRLEQAAARTFLAVPTPESLHSRTELPFVN